MMDIIKIASTVLTVGLIPLYRKNNRYYDLVSNFRKKLPRPQEKGKVLTPVEKRKLELGKSANLFTIIDTSSHEQSISEADLNLFYNSLNEYDYSFIFFKKYYKDYTCNLNRLIPKAKNGNLDLIVLQRILQDDPEMHPLKPFHVLIYQLKFKVKFSSKIYLKLKNRKERNDGEGKYDKKNGI